VAYMKDSAGRRLDAFESISRPEVESALTKYAPLNRTVFSGAVKRAIFDGTYTAWPYGSLFVDRDDIVQVYTSGIGHLDKDGVKRVHMRKRSAGAVEFGDRTLIADPTGAGYSATVHAAAKVANGDYVALVREADSNSSPQNYLIYRSTDRGATWGAGTQLYLAPSHTRATPAEAGSLFVTAAGTLLSHFRSALTGSGYILRSVTHGVGDWQNISLDGEPANSLEGAFCQLNDGTILNVMRKSIGSNYSDPGVPALFTTSSDDGLTWAGVSTTDIASMNNGNASIIHNAEDDTVELICSDRHPQADGKGSLWYYVTTAAEAKLGRFGTPTRIATGSPSRDFGYPAWVSLPDGTRVAHWYDHVNGADGTAAIYSMMGRRASTTAPGAANADESLARIAGAPLLDLMAGGTYAAAMNPADVTIYTVAIRVPSDSAARAFQLQTTAGTILFELNASSAANHWRWARRDPAATLTSQFRPQDPIGQIVLGLAAGAGAVLVGSNYNAPASTTHTPTPLQATKVLMTADQFTRTIIYNGVHDTTTMQKIIAYLARTYVIPMSY
jgi:hypothetical protein